jgi:hypothetical protein
LVDPARQDELERYGFAVVPLFDVEQVTELRRIQTTLGPAPDDPQLALNWSFHSRSQEHKAAVQALRPLLDPALDAVLADQVAYLTTFITKWPGPHGAFPPHQDPTLVDERRFTGVTVWAPLTAVGADNGMLHVVPGSHRFSDTVRVQDVDRSPFADLDRAVIERHGRGVPLAAGEAMVFDNRLIHYSLPNVTDEARVVVSFGVRPAAARCVVVLAEADDTAELHEVDDDFYVDVLPATRDRWVPDAPPRARVTVPVEAWSADDLAALCDRVGPAPRAVEIDPSALLPHALDTGVFCALCGSSEGLTEADRVGRENAQLRCPACVAALEDEVAR